MSGKRENDVFVNSETELFSACCKVFSAQSKFQVPGWFY